MLKQDWNPTGEENKGKHQLPLIGQSLFKVQAESVRAEGNRKENKGIKVVYYENLHCLFHFFGEKKSIVRTFLDWAKTTVLHFASSGRKKKKKAFNDQSFFCTKWKIMLPLNTSFEWRSAFWFCLFCVEKGPTDRHTLAHIAYTQSCTLIQEMQKITEQFKKIISRLNLLFWNSNLALMAVNQRKSYD